MIRKLRRQPEEVAAAVAFRKLVQSVEKKEQGLFCAGHSQSFGELGDEVLIFTGDGGLVAAAGTCDLAAQTLEKGADVA